MKESLIAWTDSTFNIAWGCTKISPACDNCYADTLSTRYGFSVWGHGGNRRTFGDKHWAEPLKWNATAQRTGQRHKVFCSSMCDVFEDHPVIDQQRQKLWSLIRVTPWLDWQILTKRSGRIAKNLPNDWGSGYPNVWLGVSIENNDYAWRADHLRSVPAVVRFISYEPALGPIDHVDLTGISWIIFGGESGQNFRRFDPRWPRDVRDRCAEMGTAFFFKQTAAYKTETAPYLIEQDGTCWQYYQYPGQLNPPKQIFPNVKLRPPVELPMLPLS
jgi:protein gp37